MTPNQRKSAFIRLGELLETSHEELRNIIDSSRNFNAWFTPDQVESALISIRNMLRGSAVNQWFNLYDERFGSRIEKKIGLVLAGNIPMVGFHDILCVLASGQTALIKLSSQDQKLIPYLLQRLAEIEPSFSKHFKFIDRLEGFDAVIATGSNNSSRYFDYYFRGFPHIIRKNRTSVAVLAGDESIKDLNALGKDIFSFYGLGCRNISKLYVPEGYDFRLFFESIQVYEHIANHHKYNNNYDYNKSIFLVNRVEHLDNGFLLLKRDESLASPLAVLYYEEYTDLKSLETKLSLIANQIQCTVAGSSFSATAAGVNFGKSQEPELWDYADGIDTMHFLLNLN